MDLVRRVEMGLLGTAILGVAVAVAAAAACGGDGRPGNQDTSGAGASGGGGGGAGGAGGAGATSPVSDAGETSSPADAALPTHCNGSVHATVSAGPPPPAAPPLTIAAGLRLESVAAVPGARELVALPNGDLLVATLGSSVYVVPNADVADAAIAPGAPTIFASFDDAPAQGIAYATSTCTLYVGAQHGVYAIPYADGQLTAAPREPIARVRSGPVVHTASDEDTHVTTSVAVASGKLYAAVGSSCNACTEVDPTRATIQAMNADGTSMTARATRIRNAIALAENPATGALWAGNAGQDGLPFGHPYEFFDLVTAHPGVADYGWPDCEENNHAYGAGADCSRTVAPLVELPAYSTIIGAAFYPTHPAGLHAFPATYRGGAFLTAHGSWHTEPDGTYAAPPRVVFVAMNGDVPRIAVDFTDPTAQWIELVGGFQSPDGRSRIGRPTGIAVGPQGSLFVSDDQTGLVLRIRPI